MKRIILGVALVLLGACGTGKEKVTLHTSGTGPTAEAGHVAYVTFRYYKKPSQVLADTKNASTPPGVALSANTPDHVMAHYLLNRQVGDSLSFQIMARDYFMQPSGILKLPEGVNASDNITFRVRLDSVVSQATYDSRAAEREARIADAPRIRLQNRIYETRTYYDQVLEGMGVRKQIAEDGKRIDAEIARRGEVAFKTANGVRMVIVEEELGDLISPGDYVWVNYTGTLLSGEYFDSNRKEVARQQDDLDPRRVYQPMKFQLGVGQVIFGWDEAFKTLSAGSTVVLYIPSPMAYGTQGSDGIPPDSPLRFEIDILKSQKPF